MSFPNPTPLRVGATGTLHGWTVTVAGRVVLGVELDGERYYWNEYNLVDANGRSGSLVYEEAENGPEWKLFQLLPPTQTPLTVAEAETKRVGDRVSFGGAPIPVTLVDRSRVYHIEGTPPEGVELGDLADFFNADAGDHMIVASWTGNEIEFYEGRDVPAGTIATAFGLPGGSPAFLSPNRARETTAMPPASRRNSLMVLIALGVIGLVSAYSCFSPGRPSSHSINFSVRSAPVPAPAPALRLAIGTIGNLGQRNYLVDGHALVQIARVGGRFERREYQLASEGVESALLVNGLTGGTRQWHLLQSVPPPPGFSPYDAAAQRKGSKVNFGGAAATVTELFLSQTRAREGSTAASMLPGDKAYGFLATGVGEVWLARWTEQGLALQRGTAVDEKTVFTALGPGPEKSK